MEEIDWRGAQLSEEHGDWIDGDDCFKEHQFFQAPVLLCGDRQYKRLLWETDADSWYEQQAALLKERAPA